MSHHDLPHSSRTPSPAPEPRMSRQAASFVSGGPDVPSLREDEYSTASTPVEDSGVAAKGSDDSNDSTSKAARNAPQSSISSIVAESPGEARVSAGDDAQSAERSSPAGKTAEREDFSSENIDPNVQPSNPNPIDLFAVDMAIDDDLTLGERLATIADAQTDELKSMFMKVFGRETQSKNDNWIRRAVTMRYRAMHAANSAASRGEKVYMLSKKATSNFVVIDAEGQMVLRRKARAVVVPAQIKSVQKLKQPGTSKALKTDSSINEDEAPKEKELGKTMHTWKSCPFARLAPVPTSHTTSGMITCANCLALDLLFADTSWNR